MRLLVSLVTMLLVGSCRLGPQDAPAALAANAAPAADPPAIPPPAPPPRPMPRPAPAMAPTSRIIAPPVTVAADPGARPSPQGVTVIDVRTSPDEVLEAVLLVDAGRLRLLLVEAGRLVDASDWTLPELGPGPVTFARFLRGDRDALAALVVAGGTLRVLDRSPDGWYVEATRERLVGTPPAAVQWLTTADIDADGDDDVLVTTAAGLRILTADDDGTLLDATARFLPRDAPRGARVLACDTDDDRDLDVVLSGPAVHVLENDGRGRLHDVTSIAFGGDRWSATAVLAIDADQDWSLDLVLLRAGAPDRLLRNDGRGHFTAVADGFLPEVRATDGAVADLTKDGDPDIVSVGSGGVALRTAVDGRRFDLETWRLPRAAELPHRVVTTAQVDGHDGRDLLVGGPAGLRVWLATDDEHFVDESVGWVPPRTQ